MSEVEKVIKPRKKQTSSGSVGQEPQMYADSSRTRPTTPPAIPAPPSSKFDARATSAPCGLGQGARQHLPETEVKLEFTDVEEKASSGPWKTRSSSAQKMGGRDPSQQRKRARPLPSSLWVPVLDQDFREGQEGGLLGLDVLSEETGPLPGEAWPWLGCPLCRLSCPWPKERLQALRPPIRARAGVPCAAGGEGVQV